MDDVLDPDDGDAAIPKLGDRCHELDGLCVRQAAADLVEEEHARVGRERARELEPLAVEQAERLGGPVGPVAETAELERVDAALVCRHPPPPAARRRADEGVLEHRHPAERPRHLVRPADAEPAALRGSELRHVAARQLDAARVRPQRAGEHVQQGRLACTVRADDADGLAGGDAEIDAVEHHERTEALADPDGGEDLVHPATSTSTP